MCQSPSQHLSAGRGFYKKGEGKQSKETKGQGLKSSLRADQTIHSNKDLETGQMMVWCVSFWLLSSWFYS